MILEQALTSIEIKDFIVGDCVSFQLGKLIEKPSIYLERQAVRPYKISEA